MRRHGRATDAPSGAGRRGYRAFAGHRRCRARGCRRTMRRFLAPGAIWCDMNSVAPDTKRAGRQGDRSGRRALCRCRGDGPGRSQGAGRAAAAVGPCRAGSDGTAGGAGLCQHAASWATSRPRERDQDDPLGHGQGHGGARPSNAPPLRAKPACSTKCIASLDASEKPAPWAEKIAYNRERMETHGLRRAAEMEEAAKTLLDLGIEPVMTRGTVALQRRAANDEARLERNRSGMIDDDYRLPRPLHRAPQGARRLARGTESRFQGRQGAARPIPRSPMTRSAKRSRQNQLQADQGTRRGPDDLLPPRIGHGAACGRRACRQGVGACAATT